MLVLVTSDTKKDMGRRSSTLQHSQRLDVLLRGCGWERGDKEEERREETLKV